MGARRRRPLSPAALRAAFEPLVRAHWHVVAQVIAAAHLADPEGAIADVWAKAWAAYPSMAASERAGCHHRWPGWLATIARHVALDAQRRRAVERHYLGQPALHQTDPADPAGSRPTPVQPDELPAMPTLADPATALNHALSHLAVDELLRRAQLAAIDRAIVTATIQGEPIAWTARRLRLTLPATRARRRHALATLRALLQADQADQATCDNRSARNDPPSTVETAGR